MSACKTLAAAAALGFAVSASTATADTWPNQNITMIVPFGAGGSIDRFARGLAQHWEAELDGVSIVVENRPGASGLLGAQTFLGAPRDGHTLFIGIQPTLSANIVVQEAGFSLDDFTFVNFEQRDFGDVVVSAGSRFETFEDFVTEARERPGELSVAMILGGGTSLFGLALMQELELDVSVVTFDSGGALRTNMLGNHSDITISGAYGDLSLGDEARVLAVASPEPFPGLEDAVAIAQAYPDLNVPQIGDSRFIAVHADFADDHPEAFNDLVESYRQVYESDAYQEYIRSIGTDIISGYSGPEASTEEAHAMHEVVLRFRDTLMSN